MGRVKKINRGGKVSISSDEIRSELAAPNEGQAPMKAAGAPGGDPHVDMNAARMFMRNPENLIDWHHVRGDTVFLNRNPRFNKKTVGAYLRNLAATGRNTHACAAAGISTKLVRSWVKNCAEFAEAQVMALDFFVDTCEAELYRRAVIGIVKPIIGGADHDEVVCYVREYSDSCLNTLLRGANKEKYGNGTTAKVDVNVASGVLLAPKQIDLTATTLPIEDVGEDDGL